MLRVAKWSENAFMVTIFAVCFEKHDKLIMVYLVGREKTLELHWGDAYMHASDASTRKFTVALIILIMKSVI